MCWPAGGLARPGRAALSGPWRGGPWSHAVLYGLGAVWRLGMCVGDRLWCPGAGRRGDRHRGGWAVARWGGGPGGGGRRRWRVGGPGRQAGAARGCGGGGAHPGRARVFRVRPRPSTLPAEPDHEPTAASRRLDGIAWPSGAARRTRTTPSGSRARQVHRPPPSPQAGCDASETESISTRSSTDLDEGGRGRPAPRNRASTERVGPGASPGRCPRGRRPSASRGRPRRRARRRR